ncbi:MAG TPA: energy transducer TonB, partial [Saprospiraceae bacterium]|nr:energy transducer TonB [Saprospiraceae bacterium]
YYFRDSYSKHVTMRSLCISGLLSLLIVFVACKSGNQEVTSETTGDSTIVEEQSAIVNIDSPNVERGVKKTMSKAADKAKGRKVEEAPAEQLTAPVVKEEQTISEKEMEYNEFPAKKATYPGGVNAMNQFLAKNIQYPKDALANKIEGTVYAHIYVDQSGNREDVEFPNPLGYGLEEEVLRVIKSMPKFIPAEDQGEPVKTKLILPVKFYLK